MSSPEVPGVTPELPGGTMPEPLEPTSRREPEVLAWAKAVAQGIGDTAKDMLESAREGAAAERERRWARFRSKTRDRRKPSA